MLPEVEQGGARVVPVAVVPGPGVGGGVLAVVLEEAQVLLGLPGLGVPGLAVHLGGETSHCLPVLELAVRRFNAFAKLQSELDEARTALSDRKIIDRAKSILMSQRGLSEPDAYALLRSSAMNQGKKIVDVAQALITASDLLGGM